MTTKSELLGLVDSDFLETLATSFNNKPRYHQFDSKESLVEFCSKKFSETQVIKIFDSFRSGTSPVEVANAMKELSGHSLGLKFIEKVKPDHYMFELNMGGSICDLVFLDHDMNLVAVEIKANGDDVRRAPRQCDEYKKWADFVYLLIDEKKHENAKSILPSWTGLIIYSGKKFLVSHPKTRVSPDSAFILENISRKKLECLSRIYKIKMSGSKNDLISRLKPMLGNKKFVNDLKVCLLR